MFSMKNCKKYQFFFYCFPEEPNYVAVALSDDDKMGEDSVMECVQKDGRIQAFTSWTLVQPNRNIIREGVVSVSDLNSSKAIEIPNCVFSFFFHHDICLATKHH